MQYAYIIASLPMLRLTEAPMLSLEEFRGYCSMLSEEDMLELELALEDRFEEASSIFLLKWGNEESQLRSELARIRAEKWGVDPVTYMRSYTGYDLTTHQTIEEAASMHDPAQAERLLDERRWQLLDELSLEDPFGLDGVLAYALKLKIASRWAEMDEDRGNEKLEELMVGNLQKEGSLSDLLEVDKNKERNE